MLAPLPLVLATHLHDVSSSLILVVGIVMLALALVAWSSRRRRANRNLFFVGAAFLTFALKDFFASWAIFDRSIEHEALELILTVFDVVAVALLLVPLFRRT